MSALEQALRSLVREEVRQVVRDELGMLASSQATPRNVAESYLSVAKAAHVADVAPGTIRAWIRAGRLESRRAGRVLRVGRAELERFMKGELSAASRAKVTRRADELSTRRRLRKVAA